MGEVPGSLPPFFYRSAPACAYLTTADASNLLLVFPVSFAERITTWFSRSACICALGRAPRDMKPVYRSCWRSNQRGQQQGDQYRAIISEGHHAMFGIRRTECYATCTTVRTTSG